MDLLNPSFFVALLLYFLVGAIPSATLGAVLAKRAARPAWHGVLPAFFLPWIGLLFVRNQPDGERRNSGPAQYAMVMLLVSAILTMIAAFLPWVHFSGGNVPAGSDSVAPSEVLLWAILVWLLALAMLAGSVGLLLKGGVAVLIMTGVVVSAIGGLLLSVLYLNGPAVALKLIRDSGVDLSQVEFQVGDGAWLALVALITAYVCVIVAPFGLKVRRPELPAQPEPMPTGVGPQAWPAYGQGLPPQQMPGQPPTGARPWGSQRPSGPGSTW